MSSGNLLLANAFECDLYDMNLISDCLNITSAVFWSYISYLVMTFLLVNTLQFQSNSLEQIYFKHFLDMFVFFDDSILLCIFPDNNLTLRIFIELCRTNYVSLILQDQSYSLSKECVSIVVFQTSLNYKYPTVDIVNNHNNAQSIFLIYNSLENSDLKNIEYNLNGTLPPRIISVSLNASSVLMFNPLSSTFSITELNNIEISNISSTFPTTNRPNLRGISLNVAALDYPPFFIIQNETHFDGIEVLLVKELARQLNFTPKFLSYKQWGYLSDDGTWTQGLGEIMQKRKAEIAIANIWQIPSLYASVDFSPTLNRNRMTFLVRRPQLLNFQWHALLTIFHYKVWLGTGIYIVLVAFLNWFDLNLNRNPNVHKISLSKSYLTVFGYLVLVSQKTNSIGDKFYITRYLMVLWSVFSLLLTTALSSGVFARLTLPLYSPRLDTVEQLVESDYYWTVQYYSRLNNTEIKESIFDFDDCWQSLFERKYEYLTAEEVKEKVVKDNKLTFPVHTYGEDLVVIDTDGLKGNKVLKQFRLASQIITKTHISFGVKKNSPLFESLTDLAHRYLEVGLLRHWKNEVIKRWPIYDTGHIFVEQDELTFNEPQQLQFTKVQPVFYVLIIGLTVSVLVFLFEIMY